MHVLIFQRDFPAAQTYLFEVAMTSPSKNDGITIYFSARDRSLQTIECQDFKLHELFSMHKRG